jgi:ATP-dependent Clp protease ATP-binding subunit ClpA
MGVSKQAAQKRFVPAKAADLFPSGHPKPFSRFTDRAIRVIAAAGKLSAADPIGAAHVTAALLTEPEGVAAKAITAAGLSPEQVYAAIGTGPASQITEAESGRTQRAALLQLEFDGDAQAALKDSLKWALRLGHNYIGTEHLLLGVMFEGGPTSQALTALGLPPQRAEQLVTAELEAFQNRKAAN